MRKSTLNPPPGEVKKLTVKLSSLILDNLNPRFANLTKDLSQSELLKKLSLEKNLDELIQSFQENGYYEGEPLLVIESPSKSSSYIVIEGNRRLAALKILLDDSLMEKYGFGKSKLTNVLRNRLQNEIPVIQYPSRESLWSYLGFRHIKGAMSWDSYSKALYIVTMSDDYKLSIDEISRRIGDKNSTIIKMFNGMRVLDQAIKHDFIDPQQMIVKFNFSHLYTILFYKNTRKYLGVYSQGDVYKKNPVPKSRIRNLKLLLELIYGDKEGNSKPAVVSQNPDIKRLDKIIGNSRAISYLRQNVNDPGVLDDAFQLTPGVRIGLEDFLNKANSHLRKVSENLHLYKGDPQIYTSAVELKEILDTIVEFMKGKKKR